MTSLKEISVPEWRVVGMAVDGSQEELGDAGDQSQRKERKQTYTFRFF